MYIYKISRLKLTSTRRDGGLFEQLEYVQQNQMTRLANKEIQNKNKRPQRLLDKAGPLSSLERNVFEPRTETGTEHFA